MLYGSAAPSERLRNNTAQKAPCAHWEANGGLSLINHLFGAGEQAWRDFDAQQRWGFQGDSNVNLSWKLDW